MKEKKEWTEQIKRLDLQIGNIIDNIPYAFYEDEVLLGLEERAQALDTVFDEGLPSPEEAIKILDNKDKERYLDILRAELTVNLVKKRRLIEANLSRRELEERDEKTGSKGFFIPGSFE